MSGLFGTLQLGTRALYTQSQGLAVAGQNLANVNNPGYSRQRLLIQTNPAEATSIGPAGTGVTAVAIQRIHDDLIDRQLQNETSTSAFWNAQQSALQSVQTSLGEALDTQAGSTGSASASAAAGAQSSLATDLSGLFSEFQTLAASPASISERAVVLQKAATLATGFNQTDARLADLNASLNKSVSNDVGKANDLLASIADLNEQITRTETQGSGTANDLRDLRQQKLEALAEFTNIDTAQDADGQLNVSISGQLLVSGKAVLNNLETYDAGGGQLKVQTSAGDALTLTGGSLQGTIDARDGSLATLRSGLNTLAATLISEVNTVHAAGFNLSGGTGANFFNGTGAADVRVNPDLVDDPAKLQASNDPAAVGNNRTATAIAALATKSLPALGGETFVGSYARQVTTLGQALAGANTQVDDQSVIQNALKARRDSVSAVSIDEEMANMVKYQKAFQASARIVSMVDSLLDEVINMKR